jgi:hypothetical protein
MDYGCQELGPVRVNDWDVLKVKFRAGRSYSSQAENSRSRKSRDLGHPDYVIQVRASAYFFFTCASTSSAWPSGFTGEKM